MTRRRSPTGYQVGWNVRYTTELTEPVRFYLRGEEYSAQIDHFVERVRTKQPEGLNSFASAAVTDRVIELLNLDAAAERAPATSTRSYRWWNPGPRSVDVSTGWFRSPGRRPSGRQRRCVLSWDDRYPLVGMDNVVLTPHIGGATYDTEANHTALMADGLAALLRGESPPNLANPEVLDRG